MKTELWMTLGLTEIHCIVCNSMYVAETFRNPRGICYSCQQTSMKELSEGNPFDRIPDGLV